MKLGVFDSGIGGISVLDSILEYNFFEEIIYYGDTARVPYGNKTPETIIKYAFEALEFFEEKKVDILIFACNSVSAYAVDLVQSKTNIKVFGVIKAGIFVCSQIAKKSDNILIIGTKATIKSQKYQKGLKFLGYNNNVSKCTPLFVPLIEEGLYSGKLLNEAMNYHFNGIRKPDIIILGCTHYPFIAKEISRYFNNAKTIHSGEAICQYLMKELHLQSIKTLERLSFFCSDNISIIEIAAKKWIKKYDKVKDIKFAKRI